MSVLAAALACKVIPPLLAEVGGSTLLGHWIRVPMEADSPFKATIISFPQKLLKPEAIDVFNQFLHLEVGFRLARAARREESTCLTQQVAGPQLGDRSADHMLQVEHAFYLSATGLNYTRNLIAANPSFWAFQEGTVT